MNKKYESLIKEVRQKGFNLREFLTRSEGQELFVDVLSDKLFAAAQPEVPNAIETVYDQVQLNQGQTMRFPIMLNPNADFVSENGEYPRMDQEITSVNVSPLKFGMIVGLTLEMMQQAQLDVMGRLVSQGGWAHRELRRREHAKCLSFFSTGPQVSTGVVGMINHGPFYPQLGYRNVFSGTNTSWEGRINGAIERLANQRVTITAKGISQPFPVTPDTIIANPQHMMDIRKVLNAGITVVSVGISTGSTPNVAGSNVFNGVIQNQIFDPEIPTGQAFILKSKMGLVTVNREGLTFDELQNFYFDAQDLKTRQQFLPAVVDDRWICDIQIS